MTKLLFLSGFRRRFGHRNGRPVVETGHNRPRPGIPVQTPRQAVHNAGKPSAGAEIAVAGRAVHKNGIEQQLDAGKRSRPSRSIHLQVSHDS